MGKQRWKRVISRYDSMVLGVMDTETFLPVWGLRRT